MRGKESVDSCGAAKRSCALQARRLGPRAGEGPASPPTVLLLADLLDCSRFGSALGFAVLVEQFALRAHPIVQGVSLGAVALEIYFVGAKLYLLLRRRFLGGARLAPHRQGMPICFRHQLLLRGRGFQP